MLTLSNHDLPMWQVLLAAGAALAVVKVTYSRWTHRNKIIALGGYATHGITGYLPLNIDTVWRQIRSLYTHDTFDYFQQEFENDRHTLELALLGDRLIITDDPENIKAVLTTQFKDFGKGHTFHEVWNEVLGDGIFSVDGDQWQATRDLWRPVFSKERLADVDLFERHLQNLLRKIKKGNGYEGELGDMFLDYTMDTSTESFLGESVGAQTDKPRAGHIDFATHFRTVQHVSYLRAFSGPIQPLIPTRGMLRSLEVVDDFIGGYIDQTLRAHADKKLSIDDETPVDPSKPYASFLDLAVRQTRNPKHLRDGVMSALLAGRDTTAAVLMWTFYELARNPDVVRKLRQEISETIGMETRPDRDSLKKMTYLKNVINEVLRMYPTIPFNIRAALKDTSLPRGGGPDGTQPVGVPVDTHVVYSALIVHRRKDLFGPDANEFKPDRWDTLRPKAWTFVPFNGGPRICMGQMFALTQIYYVVVRMFQNFGTIRLVDPTVKPKMKVAITLIPSVKLDVVFENPTGLTWD